MTAAVVGTAAHVGASSANKKAQAQQANEQAQIAAARRPGGARSTPSQAQQAAGRGRRSGAGAAAPAAPVDPVTAQLQNLASLHSQGILSDEEYAAAKAKALGI